MTDITEDAPLEIDPLTAVLSRLNESESGYMHAKRRYEEAGHNLKKAGELYEECQADFENAFEERKSNWRDE